MKKGDVVVHDVYGRGVVIGVYESNKYPIHVVFDNTDHLARTFKDDDQMLRILER